MRIEHVAVYVADLEEARGFFETYFGARAGALYHNQKTGFRSYFLSFDGGARLEIMDKPGLVADEHALSRRGYAHVAMSVGSAAAVGMINIRMDEQLHHAAQVAQILELVVDPGARSGGIGHELFRAGVSAARDASCVQIELETSTWREGGAPVLRARGHGL